MMDKLSAVAAVLSEWFRANGKLLIACFAVGLICHFQMYSQGLTVFDGVISEDSFDGYGWYVSGAWDIGLGRWGLKFASFAKSGLCSPVIVSSITLALFAIGIVAAVDFLGIKRPCLKYLTAIVMVVTPFISSSLTYYYCSNSYALSFLCAVVAVVLQGHACDKAGFWRVVIAALLIAFSFGCYQSAMGVFCALGLASLVLEILGGSDLRRVASRFARLLLVLLIGTLLYLLINNAVLAYTGLSMGSYAGASSVGLGNTLSHLPATVSLAYCSFYWVLFEHGIFGNYFMEPKFMLVYVVALVLVFVLIAARCENKGVRRWVSLACVALFPLAANIVLLAVPDYSVPSVLMMGGFVVLLALLPALVQLFCFDGLKADSLPRGGRRIVFALSCIALALLSWSYALQSNADSEVMRIEQNQIQSLATRVTDALESNADVQAGAKVLIAGTPQDGNYPLVSSFRSSTSNYVKLGMISSGECYNNLRCWHSITKEFAGVDMKFCTTEEYRALCQSAELQAMPTYPNEGSVATINGVVVLKMSDTSTWV